MNILIKQAYNTYNYGSMMMVENIISYFNKFLGEETKYYIDTNNESHINRLKQATEYKNIFKDKIYGYKLLTEKIKYVRYIERKIRENLFFEKKIKFYDAVIILGGDDFAETYFRIPADNLSIKNVLKTLDKINLNSNLFMIGQTIGPYTGERKEWAKETFSKIKIYSRDDISAKYMLDELDKEVYKSRDLAFLDLNLQTKNQEKEILNKYSLKESNYVVIVGTGLIDCYTENEDLFVNRFSEIIDKAKKRYPDKEIVWLSHVVTPFPAKSDNTMLEILKNKGLKDIKVINDIMLPYEARFILGGAYLTITCRMHAAVSTFQMGKPAICLSYSPKYKGVIGDGLKMKDLIIEAKGTKKWEGDIIKELESKMNYVDNNYPSLQKKIEEKVKNSKEMVLETIKEITNQIKK